MRNLILFYTLVGVSLVFGLPVQDNVRSIHHDKAKETLLQDVQGLKEQLQAVEMELENFEARETAFKPLEDIDNRDNFASDQEIAELNRHFQSVKQQIYGRPAHMLEEEEEEEETTNPAVSTECQLQQLIDMEKDFVDSLRGLASRIRSVLPTSYIQSDDPGHQWHCFVYPAEHLYAVIHEVDGEFEYRTSNGDDLCTCSDLVQSMQPTQNGDEVLAEELKQAMTLNDGRMMETHRPAYMNEDETPECDMTGIEIKNFNDQSDSVKERLIELSQRVTDELPERFIVSPDEAEAWHCFIYRTKYAVLHEELDGGFEEQIANEGTSDCTCFDLVQKIQDQLDEKKKEEQKEEERPEKTPEEAPEAMSMWDEWNGANRLADQLEGGNMAVSFDEDVPEEPAEDDKSDETKCDPTRLTVNKVSDDRSGLQVYLDKIPDSLTELNDDYIASEDGEYHCFKYGMAPNNMYVIVHGSRVRSKEGQNFCVCFEMYLVMKDEDSQAKSMWEEWSDDSNLRYVPAHGNPVQNQWENRNEMEYNHNPVQNQWENRNEMEYNRNPVEATYARGRMYPSSESHSANNQQFPIEGRMQYREPYHVTTNSHSDMRG